jgi:nucleoside-diphosphate-sugar epimerase
MLDERHFSNAESVLADCREPHRMLETMQRFKPDVIFHAAAYKHVPLMEANPLEAVRNNAIATRITAETAAAAKAERFVLISTDKAVNPQTVMGASSGSSRPPPTATRAPASPRSVSATCSPPRAAWCRSSAARSSAAARSPSPTRR